MAETLSAPPTNVSADEAITLARGHYDLDICEVAPLTSERDQNLRLRTADGRRWVMKLSNPLELRLLSDFQTEAMVHLETHGRDLPLPRLLRTRDGRPSALANLADGRNSILRIISWCDGVSLASVPKTKAQRRNAGRLLARLGRAFQGFSHPGQNQYMQWDISHLDRLAGYLPFVQGGDMQALVAGVLEQFGREVKPALQARPVQVIYNDLNHYNLLVDPDDPDRITGLIDFGDITTAPLINDLAVGASYQFGPGGSLDEVGEFVQAYHSISPINAQDAALLPQLIAARLAMTLLITGYRADLHPANATYILRNNAPARAALATLRGQGDESNAAWIMALLEDAK